MQEDMIEEALKVAEQAEPKNGFTHNQDLLNLILVIIRDTVEKVPDSEVAEITYLAVKSVLRSPLVRPDSGSVIPAIFAYYLQAYTLYHVDQWDGVTSVSFENDAALAIFDLYIANPNDHILRRLLDMSARSIHEVIVGKLSENEDLKVEDVISQLSTLALLTETVNVYIASSRRRKNVPYIAWLRKFFKKILAENDIFIVDHDEELRDILPQVYNKAKVITIAPAIS